MSAFEILKNIGFIDWRTIYVGAKRGWLSSNDIVNYACKELSEGSKSQSVILIAASDPKSTLDILDLMEDHFRSTGFLPEYLDNESPENRKWRLAFLMAVFSELESQELQLERLQEIYGEFGYPEDMDACSPYYLAEDQNPVPGLSGSKGEGPLDAAKKLIVALQKEFENPARGRG